MLFLFDQIIRIVYGQEEIDIGVESEGNSAVDNREGGELSVGEESSESMSSSSSSSSSFSPPTNTITGLGSYV
ncbi:MAG TPA: hypothetical protein VFT71_01725, partial [Candidatus Nitrosocosmicus sp.]|nr:hypothetical protein [Candidatus Nitrosocosmicus sp.]